MSQVAPQRMILRQLKQGRQVFDTISGERRKNLKNDDAVSGGEKE
jgi:hypothetical protein